MNDSETALVEALRAIDPRRLRALLESDPAAGAAMERLDEWRYIRGEEAGE